MSAETAESLSPQASAWAAAAAYGCDMSLIESHLRRTPYERIHAHARALSAALALRQAMEQRAAGS